MLHLKLPTLMSLSLLSAIGAGAFASSGSATERACTGDNGGLALPPGFCATVFADHIGHSRHMAVASDGTVYVNTWSGRYYQNAKPHDGGFLVALKDTSGSGKADKIERFGPTAAEGNAGGTGVYLYNGKLYAETNDKIVAYDLPEGALVPSGPAKTIVSGMPITGDHPMHPLIIDAAGALYVDLGSATNSCQEKNRALESTGVKDCKELDTRGGIWRYDANKTDQKFSPGARYATGLRNGEGFALDSKGRLFATQHGRDQLHESFPQFFSQKQGQDLPAEELVQVTKGADFGWPFCYFDAGQDKLMLAPEYGGDGKKVGLCVDKTRPIAAFPAHWAPNALAIYNGALFPASYKDVALIAFHGSWNRAPSPQGGYNVVMQKFDGGQAVGKYEVFADGFAGGDKNPGQAKHRPSGLAVGPKGELYISDDIQGTIWRVTYQRDKAAGLQPAHPAPASSKATTAEAMPPEGVHPDAGDPENAASLMPPAGTTKEQVALGNKIFHGEAAKGTCANCHGSNALGLPIGPPLVTKNWLWGDGSLQAIETTIKNGVPQPKDHPGMMPPMGSATLSPEDVKAVAAYVYALNHKS